MVELEALAPHVRFDHLTLVKNRLSRTVIPRDEFIQQLTMDYRLKLEAYDADADVRSIDLKWVKLRSHRWQLMLKHRRCHGTKRRREGSPIINDDRCTVCQFDLDTQPCVELSPCQHQFHRVCWGSHQANSRNDRCPICRQNYTTIRNINQNAPPSPVSSISSLGSLNRRVEGL